MKVGLTWHTPPAWAALALADPDALLSDHAHCELGAAAAAQSLLARRPANAQLVERMGALAVEELQHFRRVHKLLRARGADLTPAERNPYVAGLHKVISQAREQSAPSADTTYDAGMVDRLLVAALVERRSLERFELLAAAKGAGELGTLYGELAPSEAGHASLFVELAETFGDEERVHARLAELAEAEGALIRRLPPASRIHSGPPAAGAGEVEGAPVGIGAGVPARSGR